MDAKPQQKPESPLSTLPPKGATSVPPSPAPMRTTLRRAAFGAVAGAVLVAGAVVAVPDAEESAPPVPGPVARAESAAAAGSPASLSDLTALIGDRQQWVETHPSDAPSWAVLGTAYVEWGLRSADATYYTRAEQALQRSLAAQPGERGNAEAWVGLGALANARHDYLAAKKWGETVRTREPKNWTAYPVLIDAYNGLGEYEAAGRATEKFGSLRKGVPALARTSEMYHNQGWREDALATAQEAADRATGPAEKAAALHRLGDLARERGEPEEAVAQYGAALRTDRSHLASLAGRARALVALDRTDEALADYRTVTAKLPRPEYVLELGELYESLDLDGDARTQYKRLRELLAEARKAGVDESLTEARYEADHGDPEAAVELMRTEWSGLRRSSDVSDALGWALHRAGRSEEGLQYAERAVETGVRDASYAYHLGMIENALGQDGPARSDLEASLRTDPEFSPLDAPLAQEALDALDGPAPGGPADMEPSDPEPAPGQAPGTAGTDGGDEGQGEGRTREKPGRDEPEPKQSAREASPSPGAEPGAAAP
ncbi:MULTISPECIES: tetratricopeptide repeat protein [Streptomyces]|uniref:Tetratricopeptide (TPR) repeat protein n=1 Tax=Streptomyces clavifer TaxID=68188 RepID=A0ABS4VB14_9ACTN|nr:MULTISPECIES: tetratricopeptide repeat protein [Streptomyces]MBP2361092.1 tetratricopeptide (TPR) repeat protein [Streptomyces clavifer]MDX2746274.1 tetratricopeptide repeat protein [Streptomyces sp. NRRL_B-2557]